MLLFQALYLELKPSQREVKAYIGLIIPVQFILYVFISEVPLLMHLSQKEVPVLLDLLHVDSDLLLVNLMAVSLSTLKQIVHTEPNEAAKVMWAILRPDLSKDVRGCHVDVI